MKHFNLLVRLFLSRLNIVSKEEFDAHGEVLSRASAKLAQLDEKITELETPSATDSKREQ